jgi:hypothetical protein
MNLQLPDFPSSLIPRLDRYAQLLEEANPGVKFTRTACVISLVARALAEVEGRHAWGRRKGMDRRQGERGQERRQSLRRWRDSLVDDAERIVLDNLRQ